MAFPHKLERVLRRRELIIETLRRHRQTRFLVESNRPQEGPYYWIPLPDGTWDLMSWFVADYGPDKTDHVDVWRQSGAPYMAERWGINPRELARLPYSVPRGRVSKGFPSVCINHGGDAPVPDDSFRQRICKEFYLTGLLLRDPKKLRFIRDDHERTQSRDVAALKTLLASADVHQTV